mmetsp:Transcript_19310/g.51965  ORF Transcript_19310/g.51965 Transcript_19310/m.51965 type:complete len:209 (+) Transcript_19310:967-1593(+)
MAGWLVSQQCRTSSNCTCTARCSCRRPPGRLGWEARQARLNSRLASSDVSPARALRSEAKESAPPRATSAAARASSGSAPVIHTSAARMASAGGREKTVAQRPAATGASFSDTMSGLRGTPPTAAPTGPPYTSSACPYRRTASTSSRRSRCSAPTHDSTASSTSLSASSPDSSPWYQRTMGRRDTPVRARPVARCVLGGSARTLPSNS